MELTAARSSGRPESMAKLHLGRNRRSSAVLAQAALILALTASASAQTIVDEAADALAPHPCSGSGCWTSHLRLLDINADGFLDILTAHYADSFEGSTNPGPFQIHTGGPTGFVEVSTLLVADWSGSVSEFELFDQNLDGFRDIVAPQGDGAAPGVFLRQPDSSYMELGNLIFPGSRPHAAATELGDVTNDGRLQLLVADGLGPGESPGVRLYRVEPDGTFAEDLGAVTTGLSTGEIADILLFDADGDFDLDLLVTRFMDGGALLLNDGSGNFAPGGSLPAPLGMHPTPCDVDGDGDLDLWVSELYEQLLINDGSGNFVDERSARVSGDPGGVAFGVLCADVDVDGDFDAVVLTSGTERLLRNTGGGTFVGVSGAFPAISDCTRVAEMGDIDGDRRLDLVTGDAQCTVNTNHVFFGNSQMGSDDRPPVVVHAEDPGDVPLSEGTSLRFAVEDQSFSDGAPRLRSVRLILDPDGDPTEIGAEWMGSTLHRSVLPAIPSATEYRVCAIDQAGNEGCASGWLGTPEMPDGGVPMEDAGIDGGASADAGADDAGVQDGGTTDSGTPPADSGPSPDAGGATSDSGCSVGAAGGREGPTMPWTLLLLWPLFRSRRR